MYTSRKISLVLFILFWVAVIWLGLVSDRNKPISQKQALTIAEKTEAVKSFYALQEGGYVQCMTKQVVRPCDTDWVTCIDEAWVVKYEINPRCIDHDGRLSVTLLIDAVSREIKSVFPEAEYFQDPQYCLASYDCLSGKNDSLNFIYGQIKRLKGRKGICKNNRCELQ